MRLATSTHGDGPRRIALVHGLAGSGALWQGLLDRVVPTGAVTVTTVDLRGHGDSDRSADHSLDAFADDLVDTLPPALDLVVGHSLGGTVLERAVSRLAPAHALYLDPGFGLALPVDGLRGRLFWAGAPLTLAVPALRQWVRSRGRSTSAQDAALVAAARDRFDRRMTVGVFREVAHHPVRVVAPAVPSTVLLSDDARAVLPDELAARLADLGWDVRRLPGVGHDFWLEDADATVGSIRDLLVGEGADPRP